MATALTAPQAAPVIVSKRITLKEGDRPALARFDIDVVKGDPLPLAFTWGGNLFVSTIERDGDYQLCEPVEIGIPTRPREPSARRVMLILQPRPTA